MSDHSISLHRTDRIDSRLPFPRSPIPQVFLNTTCYRNMCNTRVVAAACTGAGRSEGTRVFPQRERVDRQTEAAVELHVEEVLLHGTHLLRRTSGEEHVSTRKQTLVFLSF